MKSLEVQIDRGRAELEYVKAIRKTKRRRKSDIRPEDRRDVRHYCQI